MNGIATGYLKDCIDFVPQLEICRTKIVKAFEILIASYQSGGKVLICGNGGSAADADHIVGELMKRFILKRPLSSREKTLIKDSNISSKEMLLSHLQKGLPAISLSAHSALVTAISNDESAEMVFAQQVYAYGKPGDVLIGISTSGNSKNVVYALDTAKIFGIKTICFTGQSGGPMNTGAYDVVVNAPDTVTFKIQQYHLAIYHCLCAMVEAELFV